MEFAEKRGTSFEIDALHCDKEKMSFHNGRVSWSE